MRRLFTKAEAAFGSVDVLVNDAGVLRFGSFMDFMEETFHAHYNINVLRHGFWWSSPATMTNHSQNPSAIPAAERIGLPGSSARTKTIRPDGWVYVYARLALGAAFLSAVASRFGLWDRTLDLKHFAKFLEYTAEVNSFMPPATIPLLAWAATVAETSLGILLISGWWSRWVSLASAVLLAMFGTAMAISFGLKSPMDYSVFSASAAAALLAQRAFREHRQQSSPNRM